MAVLSCAPSVHPSASKKDNKGAQLAADHDDWWVGNACTCKYETRLPISSQNWHSPGPVHEPLHPLSTIQPRLRHSRNTPNYRLSPPG